MRARLVRVNAAARRTLARRNRGVVHTRVMIYYVHGGGAATFILLKINNILKYNTHARVRYDAHPSHRYLGLFIVGFFPQNTFHGFAAHFGQSLCPLPLSVTFDSLTAHVISLS